MNNMNQSTIEELRRRCEDQFLRLSRLKNRSLTLDHLRRIRVKHTAYPRPGECIQEYIQALGGPFYDYPRIIQRCTENEDYCHDWLNRCQSVQEAWDGAYDPGWMLVVACNLRPFLLDEALQILLPVMRRIRELEASGAEEHDDLANVEVRTEMPDDAQGLIRRYLDGDLMCVACRLSGQVRTDCGCYYEEMRQAASRVEAWRMPTFATIFAQSCCENLAAGAADAAVVRSASPQDIDAYQVRLRQMAAAARLAERDWHCKLIRSAVPALTT